LFQDKADFLETRFEDEANFNQVNFEGEANFGPSEFVGEVSFYAATFENGADFLRATFGNEVSFNNATIKKWAAFVEVIFNKGVDWGGTTFEGSANFTTTSFEGGVSFDGATFEEANFSLGTFKHGVDFGLTAFEGLADFNRTTFGGEASFVEATFRQDVDLSRATFQGPATLGPMVVAGTLRLDRALFAHPVQLEIAAQRISAVRSRFPAGGHIRVAWSEITLEEVEFPAPMLISDHSKYFTTWDYSDWDFSDRDRGLYPPDPPRLPKIQSVRGANVAGLAITDVDVRECRFSGAHNLDRLRVEMTEAFHRAPKTFAKTGRHVLAEECEWRSEHSADRRWKRILTASRPPSPGQASELDPKVIASLYRALRKGKEDSKDEPGAADFYYGEMEMRRKAKTTPWVERRILDAYWLLSGYGLRASRAVIALAIVIASFACAFQLYGFQSPEDPFAEKANPPTSAISSGSLKSQPVTDQQESHGSWPPSPSDILRSLTSSEAWTYSVGTATAVFSGPDADLTQVGRRLHIAPRILGPLLLGLAILSIRGRVKR
jgi:uncharacterized protein YjbI with pentapeptide repeats